MRLPRPHIPISVRVAVARRQWGESTGMHAMGIPLPDNYAALQAYLHLLFGDQKVHLDHDPPLAARPLRFDKGGKFLGYVPDANDPDYLIYRTVEDHRLKTNVRGDGAQYPDRVLIKRERRRLKKRRPKRKIANRKRQWPKRKLRGKSKWR